MSVTINEGTQTQIAVDPVSGTQFQIIKLDVGAAGASSLFTNTVGSITRLVGGTLMGGTIDTVSQMPPNYFGTTVTSGTSTLGTIKPLVAGSAIFVTDMIVSAGSATTLVIGMGGTSTPFIGTLSFAANGGMVSNFRVPGSVTSGSALVYQQSVNGPLSITVNGFVR